ncbi:sel1 repeat family protein [Helicobacter aurati]|uniref:Beta-lactamase n=1 Tax=Helicobacter aurati TaxID=137778 RepID=A0A3D8J0H8_9HELI|nr:tetratricopeptide repeat protein [Helicobacter aurati]RDU70863.1 sel1 repeat family protein [Helicobacter aurati]
MKNLICRTMIRRLGNFLPFAIFFCFCMSVYASKNNEMQARQTKIACIIDNNKEACTKLIASRLPNVHECNVEKECGVVGVIYHHAGRNKEALPYFNRIYAVSELESLDQLGIFYKQNKDYVNAKRQFELGCDKLYMPSCLNLGVLYESGLGVKQDYQKALRFYEMSCNNHLISAACYNIAVLYFNGQVNAVPDATTNTNKRLKANQIMKNNIAQAKIYFEKACSMGHEDSCEWKDKITQDSH